MIQNWPDIPTFRCLVYLDDIVIYRISNLLLILIHSNLLLIVFTGYSNLLLIVFMRYSNVLLIVFMGYSNLLLIVFMGYSNLLLIFYCVINLREHNKRLIEILKKNLKGA